MVSMSTPANVLMDIQVAHVKQVCSFDFQCCRYIFSEIDLEEQKWQMPTLSNVSYRHDSVFKYMMNITNLYIFILNAFC